MKKIKIKLNSKMDDDFNDLIDPNSKNFDVDFYADILNRFGSIENYKNSEEWKGIEDTYKMIDLIKRSN